MAVYPDWRRPRLNQAGGPIDEQPRRSALPTGAGSAAQDAGAGAQSLGWTLTRQVPEEAPPPGSTFFSQADTQNVVGVVTSPFPNINFALDADKYGVLKSINFEVTDYTKISVVKFSFLINGTPAPGLSGVQITPAAASLKTRGFDLSLPLPKGATLTVTAQDVDGGPYTVNVDFFGWQWPAAIDARYRPEGVGVR